jgi:hypothetical protein
LSDKRFTVRSLSYSTWYFLTARSLFEKIVCKVIGGFLNQPKMTISPSRDYLPVQEVDKFSVLQNVFDYRFRIQSSSRISKLDIYFESEVFKEKNYEIFCNGKLLGVSNNSGYFAVSYFEETRNFEISIRNPSHACKKCFRTLENFKVRFEYEDSI